MSGGALFESAAVREAFAQVVTDELDKRPVPRGELAARAGISRPHLYKLAHARGQPSLTVFLNSARALGVEPPELLRRVLEVLAARASGPPSGESR